MAIYPGADWRPVARYMRGERLAVPMNRYDGGCDHTEVSNWSADAAFSHYNTPGRAVPHFRFNSDGSVTQYIDTEFRSTASLNGNHRLITWETWDGFPNGWENGQAPKDTAKIVRAKAELMVWLRKEHGIPLHRMASSLPAARGFGWHRLGIDGNFPQADGKLLGGRVDGGELWSSSFGKTCPTDRRIKQFVEETLPLAIELNRPVPLVTFGHANAHNNRKAARVLRAKGCDVFSLNETSRITRFLARLDGYRVIFNKNARDQRRGSKSTTLMVASTFESYGTITWQISEQVEPNRFAPDRWISGEVVKIDRIGRVLALSVHLNATVRGRDPNSPIVKQYAQSVRTLDRLITFALAEGYEVVVGGDVNLRPGDEVDFITPYEVFEKHGMKVNSKGIDVIAHTRGIRTLWVEVLTKEEIGSDHPGLVAGLARQK